MQGEKLDKEKLNNLYKAYECNHSDRIVNILGMYRHGEYICPDVIKRNLRETDGSVVTDILEKLVKADMAEKVFQYYCPNCGRAEGPFIKEDLEEEIYCSTCDCELNKNSKRYMYLCK